MRIEQTRRLHAAGILPSPTPCDDVDGLGERLSVEVGIRRRGDFGIAQHGGQAAAELCRVSGFVVAIGIGTSGGTAGDPGDQDFALADWSDHCQL